jgi:hypothetical protein
MTSNFCTKIGEERNDVEMKLTIQREQKVFSLVMQRMKTLVKRISRDNQATIWLNGQNEARCYPSRLK